MSKEERILKLIKYISDYGDIRIVVEEVIDYLINDEIDKKLLKEVFGID